MSRVINLTPLQDELLTLVKGEQRVSIPDRIPTSLMPTIMGMVDEESNEIDLTPANLSRLCQIFGRLIARANPQMDENEAMDFLDLQDIPELVYAILNPQMPSSTSATTPSVEERAKAPTRMRKRS